MTSPRFARSATIVSVLAALAFLSGCGTFQGWGGTSAGGGRGIVGNAGAQMSVPLGK